jgi:hypothetical protein
MWNREASGRAAAAFRGLPALRVRVSGLATLGTEMARPQVTVRADGRVVCERCLVADRPWARMRGLLGRRTLPRGEGVFLRPAASIHTFFMRFPIDAVFVDAHGTVVGVEHELRPWRAARRKGAQAVLELAAGEASRRRLVEGGRLEPVPG